MWRTFHKCAFCKRRYKVQKNYNKHLATHGGDPRKMHKVDIQNEALSRREVKWNNA